jgi:cardiolipin synthase
MIDGTKEALMHWHIGWKALVGIVAAAAAVTVLLVLVVLNFMPQEKQLKRDIRNASPVASAQFRSEISSIPGPAVLDGNRVRDLQNGEEIFPAMLQAIRSAQKTINFETYIYWSGKVGEEFIAALSERARAGVQVHVLVDWVGGMKMEDSAIERLRASGAEFEYFHPLHWYTIDRINNRTHRKLLIVDGRVAFTGGVGIADAWQGDATRPDQWRDMHFQLEGPAVAQMQAVFEDNWITTTGHVLLGPDYYPVLQHVGPASAQVFSSSPDGGSENMQLMNLIAIAAARSRIDLEAAYFVPGDRVRGALLDALRRGVQLRIIMPGPHVDSDIVRDASQAQWGEMLEAGAKLYQFQPSMFHCKMMIVDGYLTMVGSANFDPRSFRLNDEANLNVYDAEFATRMTGIFEQDIARSREVTLEQWRQRPWLRKLQDEVSALTTSQI